MTAISIPLDSSAHPFCQCTRRIALAITISKGIAAHRTKSPIKRRQAPPISVTITTQLNISGKINPNEPNHSVN